MYNLISSINYNITGINYCIVTYSCNSIINNIRNNYRSSNTDTTFCGRCRFSPIVEETLQTEIIFYSSVFNTEFYIGNFRPEFEGRVCYALKQKSYIPLVAFTELSIDIAFYVFGQIFNISGCLNYIQYQIKGCVVSRKFRCSINGQFIISCNICMLVCSTVFYYCSSIIVLIIYNYSYTGIRNIITNSARRTRAGSLRISVFNMSFCSINGQINRICVNGNIIGMDICVCTDFSRCINIRFINNKRSAYIWDKITERTQYSCI